MLKNARLEQLSSYNNFKFDHSYISNLIDKVRSTFAQKKSFIIKREKSFKTKCNSRIYAFIEEIIMGFEYLIFLF